MSVATLLQWLICVGLGIAFLTQLAVYRAPELPDTKYTKISRRLMICALLVGFCYLAYLSARGVLADKPMALVLGLTALAQLNSAMCRLFPDDDPASPESQRGEL